MRGVSLLLFGVLSAILSAPLHFAKVLVSFVLSGASRRVALPLALATVLVVLAVTNAEAARFRSVQVNRGFAVRPQRVQINNFGGGFGAQSFGAFAVPGCHVNGVNSFGVQSFGFGPRAVGVDPFGNVIFSR